MDGIITETPGTTTIRATTGCFMCAMEIIGTGPTGTTIITGGTIPIIAAGFATTTTIGGGGTTMRAVGGIGTTRTTASGMITGTATPERPRRLLRPINPARILLSSPRKTSTTARTGRWWCTCW